MTTKKPRATTLGTTKIQKLGVIVMNAIDKIKSNANNKGFVPVTLMLEKATPLSRDNPKKRMIMLNIHKDLAAHLYRECIAVYGFTNGYTVIKTTKYVNKEDHTTQTFEDRVFSLFTIIERDLPNLRGLSREL